MGVDTNRNIVLDFFHNWVFEKWILKISFEEIRGGSLNRSHRCCWSTCLMDLPSSPFSLVRSSSSRRCCFSPAFLRGYAHLITFSHCGRQPTFYDSQSSSNAITMLRSLSSQMLLRASLVDVHIFKRLSCHVYKHRLEARLDHKGRTRRMHDRGSGGPKRLRANETI